ncbi:uncharacterized protein LOC126797337 [Argentina anserina]|uniref:uncharacterized protein LOC126797337 n=1 Tax=Argentina anserina TaxID=57926 RepID=UPI0021768EB7|nr:uncharacterized protein LOC126797337 [Potentilla anserina]
MVSYIFFLHVILLLCCCDYLFCSSRDTLTHADPLIDGKSESELVSAGGIFELGFFTPSDGESNSGGDGRYVGIWYHNVNPTTVVWVANRDAPIPANSVGVLKIEKGNLHVRDSLTYYWATHIGISSSFDMILKIMDSGNLVLLESDQIGAKTLWQSFQNPTDTFIWGMLMDKSLELTSWKKENDPGVGNFTFKRDQSETQHIILKKLVPYWKSGEPGNYFSSIEMPPEVAYLLLNSTDTSRRSKYNFPIKRHWVSNYTRLVMNFTGELQFWTWNGAQWRLSWSEPKDKCSVFNPCGNFGSCNKNNWPLVCKCLPGFKPQSPGNWDSGEFSGGCHRESLLSDKNSTFLSLKMMKVGEAGTRVNGVNETECREECLASSLCQAYSYAEDTTQRSATTSSSSPSCWTWLDDLNNLVEEYETGHDISVRVASSDIESTVRDCKPCGTTVIPYPLSTGPDCGDVMYSHFNCNTLTGQVSFKGQNDTLFRVIRITPSMQKFVLQGLPAAKKAGHCDSRGRGKASQLNPSSPFHISSWCNANIGSFSSKVLSPGVLNVVELSWDLPLQPACNTSADCKGWSNSTCNFPVKDAPKRCLCNKGFQWNVSNFSCIQEDSLHEPLNPSFGSSLREHSNRTVSFYLIIVAVIISMILLACVISVYIWRRKMTRNQDQIRRTQFDSERLVKELIDTSEFNKEDEKGIDVPFFDLQSILEATDNFSEANKLGQGGYGPVYKGKFLGGQEIAVKRLSKVSGQGLQEFRNEVVLIAKLQHRNLVRLRGYCMKGGEKILLYEYMPNKSLDSFIFDDTRRVFLNWEMRYNIILGIARGLLYLHQDSRLRIVHRDLKTSNVLLDEEMNPKISDFGLARIVGGKETEANTNTIVGTYGYMSPEYALDGAFSAKSDVFSFGVVLLEIISGKKNAGFYQSKQTFSLIGHAWELWTEDKVLDIMDKNLQESCNRSQFIKCVNVGLLCVQEDPVDRPTMSNVITLLDSETAIPATPKQPAFFLRRGNSSTASSSTKPEIISEITTLEDFANDTKLKVTYSSLGPVGLLSGVEENSIKANNEYPCYPNRSWSRRRQSRFDGVGVWSELCGRLKSEDNAVLQKRKGELIIKGPITHTEKVLLYQSLDNLPNSMVSSIIFLYVVLLLCSCDNLFCSARDTLTHEDPLIDDGSEGLVSAGETFELGFFTPTSTEKGSSGADIRYVGIWYHELNPKTVVWVVNRDTPIPANSVGVLTIEEGKLCLLDNDTRNSYWSGDIGTSGPFNMTLMKLKIMDSGNLVLSDTGELAADSLWQSFEVPTDTFLPGMLMHKNFRLTSWREQNDPRVGNFTFKLDQGEKQYIILKKSVPYWKSGEPGNQFSSDEMRPEVAYLLSNFSRSTDTSIPSVYNVTIVRHWNYNYTRLVIHSTGELQLLAWNEGEKKWLLSWSQPEDQCSVFNPCGNFGSCNHNNLPLVCKCLPGFKPRSPEYWDSGDYSGGCYREPSMSDHNSTFLSLKMMKVGEADSQFDVGSETECRKECLENHLCTAYSYAVLNEDSTRRDNPRNSSCWTWLEDLNNLVEEHAAGHNISVRVGSSDIESTVRDCEPCGTTMIPYPLSTGPDCGDRMYSRFKCNNLTGQVSFVGLKDTFRVISIIPSTQIFLIQGIPRAVPKCDSRNRAKALQLNPSFPFKMSSWCSADLGNFSSGARNVLELGWELSPEPACNTSADCKGWPNSTCNPTRDGTKRCLCNISFQWNASNFKCSQEGSLHDPSNPSSQSSLGYNSNRKVPFSLIIVAVLVSMILLACTISILVWRRKMTNKQDHISRAQLDSERRAQDLIDTSEFNEEDEKGLDVPFFDLQSILEATDNFSDGNKLGQGGYGPVYKGMFPGGQEMAVKRLSKVSGQGLQEFRNEVVLIAKLQHRNLVRLKGFCMKGEEKILLYEYMLNKSLDSFIFDHTKSVFLNWEMRFNIILGVARGLLYLHQDSRLRIIHRDLKTSNVLLDEEMNPKISDFGLARIVGGKETEANTNTVVGTYGYMSPEYALDGTFSVKSDVFSFGVVILEIISGKKNAGFFQSKQTFSLLGYAWELWTEDKVLDIMDKNLDESCNRSQFIV